MEAVQSKKPKDRRCPTCNQVIKIKILSAEEARKRQKHYIDKRNL